MDDDELEKFIERVKLWGIDVDEVVYSLNIRDLLMCIAEAYGDETSELDAHKLKMLIKISSNAAEDISWFDLIVGGIKLSNSMKGDFYG